MKSILKLEEAAMLLLSVCLFYTQLHFSGWIFWALFLLPDIGIAGYAVNPRVGAVTYNLLHHKGIAIIIYVVGLWMSVETLQLAGLVLFGHSSFDRMFGYGLKYSNDFSNTHLGKIGKQAAVGRQQPAVDSQ
jgi:hypothetical protein